MGKGIGNSLKDIVIALRNVNARLFLPHPLFTNSIQRSKISCLWFIGVNPELHGKGIGRTFIQEVIKECERKKAPSISRLQWRIISRFTENLDLRSSNRCNFHIHFISCAGCNPTEVS